MKKYTVAIIGTGRIGLSLGFDEKREQPACHSFAFSENKRVKLCCACDINAKNLNSWKNTFPKALAFSSVDELLEYGKSLQNKSFDIIVVAVNECAHLDCSLKAINSKPRLVVLEKPVALNMEEATKIEAASKSANVPVLINHERRFAEDYRIARSFMDKIGQIQTINARLFSGMPVYRESEEKTGFYSLLHDGSHLVDAVLYFLERLSVNQPENSGVLFNPKLISLYKDEKGDVRNLSVNFCHKMCSDVNIYISGRSRYFGFEVEVIGTEGCIKIGNGFAGIYRRTKSNLYSGFYSLKKLKTVTFPKKTKYFSLMVKNAVDFLDGKANIRSTLENGINAMKIIEQMKDFCR